MKLPYATLKKFFAMHTATVAQMKHADTTRTPDFGNQGLAVLKRNRSQLNRTDYDLVLRE